MAKTHSFAVTGPNEGVITVEEAKSIQTELDVVEAMQFDRGYVSPYFVTNAEKMIAELDQPYILIHEKKRLCCRVWGLAGRRHNRHRLAELRGRWCRVRRSKAGSLRPR